MQEWGSNFAKENTARKASGEYSRINASGSANSPIFCAGNSQKENRAPCPHVNHECHFPGSVCCPNQRPTHYCNYHKQHRCEIYTKHLLGLSSRIIFPNSHSSGDLASHQKMATYGASQQIHFVAEGNAGLGAQSNTSSRSGHNRTLKMGSPRISLSNPRR